MPRPLIAGALAGVALLALAFPLGAQSLINIDFGVGSSSAKTGFAATGMSTNDVWNLYRHYEPKFVPGTPLVSDGQLAKLKFADGSESDVSIAVTNAPGVWGNATGDPMYDTYIFAQNGSNILLSLHGLPPGRYHFYLYGHADPDVTGEQNSLFTLKSGTNTFGPLTQSGALGWKAGLPWTERGHYIVFRDVPVEDSAVLVQAAPGPNGVAVLNGLQIISRGTSPPRLLAAPAPEPPSARTNLLFREIRYDGKVTDTDARFTVTFDVESLTTNLVSELLFDGDLALLLPDLPKPLRIVSQDRQTRLFCSAPGSYTVKLELLAKITRAEPWNQISFLGPPAAIASVSATAAGQGIEIQLLSGTQRTSSGPPAAAIDGFLGADRSLSMRWQSKATEVTRKSLVTVETDSSALITPTVVKFTTALRYEILQAPLPRLTIELPPTHALTRIQGQQIRDWQVKPDGQRQLLTIDFIKPVEKNCSLTLFSEQTVEQTPASLTLAPPQPLDIERESGSFTLSADDTTVAIPSAPGLRQINAPAGALAAYRFNARPAALTARIERIEPVLKLAARVTARLEETRLLLSHTLNLNVEKAGIYSLELSPQPGFLVTEVKGDGIDDWKLAEGKLRISFAARVLGARKLDIQLEQAHKEFPEHLSLQPLLVLGATNVTTHLGASSSPGIRLKTAELSSLREVPITSLPSRSDELLAFVSEQSDWRLSLAAERLAPRVLAEVFNLVTIGDGLVGGSATIRYGILNQGVQQFRLALPAHWKNIEFTGANIRRKEQQTNLWTITLQDKAWGGYTLVVTYDYQFDPKGATLDLAGAHALNVERETGSLGLMTAASLNLSPASPADPLRRVDEAELSENDRALCTRPLLLAYKYAGGDYRHSVQVTRFEDVLVLDAVADRIELTTVLTDEGQLLTQSSFMVKNNDKQFQKFKLPPQSQFWSSYVNGQPAKPERDADWLLVPLPRDANRDQAFAVDIVYAQKMDLKTSLFPRRMKLAAPLTDIPSTYAEWQLFVPVSQRLTRFGGNMTVATGTTYELRDAWQEFVKFYATLIEHHGGLLLFGFVLALLFTLIAAAARRGVQGAMAVLVTFGILAILAAMMLPALSKAKAKSQRINAMNNLKQIGLAAKTWALDNNDAMPPNFDAMINELSTDKVTIDPNTGQRFVYVGAGKNSDHPEAVLAYSPSDVGGRAVLFADGSVQLLNAERFQEALQRDAALPRPAIPPGTPPPSQAEVAAQQIILPPGTRPQGQSRPQTIALANRAPEPPPPATIEPAAGPQPPQSPRSASAPAVNAPAPRPTAAGVRPIRIDVPRSGQAFSFTKVLNAGQEPLTASASIVRLRVYRAFLMVMQVTAFLLGLLLFAILRLCSQRSSLGMAVAASLVLWSIASLLTLYRLLHVALIAALPALLLLLITWAICKYRAHLKNRRAPTAPTPDSSAPASTATAISLLLAAGLASTPARAQDKEPAPAPSAVSILSAAYTGTVLDKVALLDLTLSLSTAATNQLVPLFNDEVAVESFVPQADARLVRQGRSIAVLFPARTNATLHFKLVAKLGGEVTRRRLAFGIPPALASQVSLRIDEAEADVEFPSAVALQRTSTNHQTRVEAVLGPVDRLELNWTPRVKRAAEITATVFAQNTALVTLGGGVLNTRVTLDYQISQGELKQVRVQIPPGQRLLRVEGDSVRIWEVKADLLTVELLKGVSPTYRLTLETEKLLDKLPATARVDIPHALDVKRETGLLALRGSEELDLAVERAQELQRVDADEFHRASSDKLDAILSAFRFLRPDFALLVRADTVQPQLEAIALHAVRIGSESIQMNARIDYTIKRAGVFALRLRLPSDYRLDSVVGLNVSQWVERDDQGSRLLDVTLKERTQGSYSLNLILTRSYKDLPKTVPVVGVLPINTIKLSGIITVTTEHGIAAKTDAFDGVAEIPFSSANPASSASPASGLAYKFVAPSPSSSPSWRLSVSTEAVEPWVRAEILNSITLSETLVSGRTLLKYDVANAPVKEFRLRVPAGLRNVEIQGSQIRRRDETNGEWRVELQSKVRGEYRLLVAWEFPRSQTSTTIELTGVQALAVEREAGFITVVARPPLQVTDKSSAELLSRIDLRELPDWTGRPDPATVLAYRYLRPGYRLALDARRFDEAEVLQALVDNARFTTVVADDGQMMTEVALSIRNNGRQHLEVELPSHTTLWSAFVAGEPVRPSRREGKLLLPLARDIASDAPVAVELTFIGDHSFPKRRGPVALVSPKFDMPLKNARWDLYLPPDYDYSHFSGSMNRTSAAAAPAVQVYSLSEYNVQQRVQEEQRKFEMRYGLQSARANLTSGNLRQAISSFNKSKVKGQQYKQAADEDRELKAVENDLRKAQSSNLLVAQNNYYIENAGRLADQPTAQLPQGAFNVNVQQQALTQMPAFLNNDAEVAGLQWDKLEKAQQVAVAKVAPLRVNLPTRGARYSFAQVLQTEINKPMTVHFLAHNTKTPGWTSRLALAALGFGLLWLLMALLNRRTAPMPH